MTYFQNLKNSVIAAGLFLAIAISISLHLTSPTLPCFNSDEASFAYNAYSIAKTARDEYGKFMPSRFLAFGENKLPVTIYLIAPFVSVLGLTEEVARLPFMLMGIFSPLLFFLLIKFLTKKVKIALIGAFLAAISPWIQIMSRHIHENIIMLILTIGGVYFLSKLQEKVTFRRLLVLSFLTVISLFTYHMGKIIAVFILVWSFFILLKNHENKTYIKKSLLIFFIPVLFFIFTEFQNPTSRISNLLFLNEQGFILNIENLRNAHDSRLIHNKLTHAVLFVTNQYLSYFSPEFLVIKGDANQRFGQVGVSPITPIEYFLIFIGIYFAFKKKLPSRYILLTLLLVAPMSAALSYQNNSITRSFLMILPIIVFVSYGINNLISTLDFKFFKYLTILTVFIGISFFSFMSWESYFNHYLKSRETAFAWQCGYKDLGDYINENYDKFDTFYITKKLGQPYIFTLFYLKFPPSIYQTQAKLSTPDEYGFGQVERFDKFIFDFKKPDKAESAAYIGYEEDFDDNQKSGLKKIVFENTNMFFIYESPKNN